MFPGCSNEEAEIWGHGAHSDSLMCWDTATTLLGTRGPMQGFLQLSLPWFLCLCGMLGKWSWSSTPTQLTSDYQAGAEASGVP